MDKEVGHERVAIERGKFNYAFAWLYTFVKPHGKAIAGLLFLSLLASSLVLLQPWLTKLLIDDGLIARDYDALVLIVISMILLGMLATGLAGINRYLHTRLSGRILFALREHLYSHLQTLSPRFYGGRRIGDILSRLDGDVAQIQRFAVDSLFAAVSSIIGLLGASVLMVVLSWKLSLLILVLLPLEVLWLRWMRRKVEHRTRVLRERSADLSSFLVETLPAMKFIQAVAQEGREARRLNRLGDHYLTDLLKLQVIEFFTQAIPGTLTSITRASAFLIGGYWVIEGQWHLGSLIAFSTYLGMATGPVQSLLGLYVGIQKMSVSLDRVMDLQRAEPAIDPPEKAIPLKDLKAEGEICFEQVAFSYGEKTASQIFQAASGVFPAGAKVALKGASGAGKSTLVDLIMRYYDPAEGRVLLDGIDLKEFNPADLRSRIALVSQDITLFRGSIDENIRYACPAADNQAVRTVIERVQLSQWVDSLPLGLDTLLGERGTQLSGGQKQRLAIARALLQDPLVLILDEATSAVDEATEAQVIAAVDELFSGRTRILISHRSSTLEGADHCFCLQQGQLIKQ
ncbi:ABC transporter ATP-binding protein [Motiliproteus sp. MSK22-1]|nr:ABC transporter ATP-binding protein [Motiliproteus sp. MSK22-1]